MSLLEWKPRDYGDRITFEDIGFSKTTVARQANPPKSSLNHLPFFVKTTSPFSTLICMSPLSTSSENLDTVSISSGISVDKTPPSKNGKWFKDDLGGLLRIPFDRFTTVEEKGAVDKEMFIMDPHYRNFKILDFLRKL
jgi:hypothetical protein